MLVQPMRKRIPKLDLFSTLEPLNNVLKIFGMSCVSRDGVKLKYSWSTCKISFYVILFFIINAFIIFYKIYSTNDSSIITFSSSLEIIYLFGYNQYIVDIFFVYKYGRQSYLDYLSLYDYIDSLLSMPYNMQIKRCIRRFCIFFIVIGFFTISIDYLATTISFGCFWSSIYLINYLYFLLRILSALDTISHCAQISFRLKTIGDVLENYYCNAEILPYIVKSVVKDELKVKFYHFDFAKFIRTKHNIVKNLSRSYLLIIEQNNYVNTMYGFRIMLNHLLYLLDMIMLLNMMIRLTLGTMVTPNDAGYLLIISSAIRFVTCFLIIFSGTYICEKCYNQNERICRLIIHLLMNKKIPPDEHETLVQLKDWIKTRPIRYHVMNFYRLEYATLVSLISSIVTYTFILLENVK